MFMTHDALRAPIPPGIADPSHRFWGSIALSIEMPWYLVTQQVPKEGRSTLQTILVAWESTLLNLIAAGGEDTLVSAHCVSKTGNGAGEWAMKKIQELWEPAADEAPSTGPLLFRFAGDEDLHTSHMDRLTDSNSKRRLLARTRAAPKAS